MQGSSRVQWEKRDLMIDMSGSTGRRGVGPTDQVPSRRHAETIHGRARNSSQGQICRIQNNLLHSLHGGNSCVFVLTRGFWLSPDGETKSDVGGCSQPWRLSERSTKSNTTCLSVVSLMNRQLKSRFQWRNTYD